MASADPSRTTRNAVPRLGAWVEEGPNVRWRVWAPGHQKLEVVIHDARGQPGRIVPLTPEPGDCFGGVLEGHGAGTFYKLRVDGEGPFPDPWSRSQPMGVHGPSQVVVPDFEWTDAGWKGVEPESLVIYEVHVGTATPEGTFEALIPRLPGIKELGVTALEIMPVAAFPGVRNWGYDGVDLFAPLHAYGGPEGLRRLIDAAHARGTRAEGLEPWRFVHCIQNHDQVGNRPFGNRLAEDVSPAAFRAMSTLLLLSPYTPLLFMGQEWNASTPFLYFTDHNEELGRLVTEGRRKEFAGFTKFAGAEVPDPQAPDTFNRSRLDWAEADKPEHAGVRALYRELLRLRATEPVLKASRRGTYDARALGPDALVLERREGTQGFQVLVSVRGTLEHRVPSGAELVLWTEAPRFGGTVEQAPLTDGTLRLQGPAAAVVRFPVKD